MLYNKSQSLHYTYINYNNYLHYTLTSHFRGLFLHFKNILCRH